jgi:hypothetical protein
VTTASEEPLDPASVRPRAPEARTVVVRRVAFEPARALALFTLTLGVFFAPALSRNVAFLYRDNGRMHVAHKRLVAEALSRGKLPEWNPFGGLGFPMVGGAVDAVQHPFNALLVALPFDVGFKAWTLLSFLLAAMGAFAWLRTLGLGFAAAVTGGIATSLSGFLVSSTDNLQYLTALATVPLMLATTHAFVARGGRVRLACVGLASALAAAAGDPQSWGITTGALPFYALLLVEGPVTRRDRVVRGLTAAGAAAVAAAPFILPVLAWMPHSSRGDALFWIERERYNLVPFRALEFAVPGLFRTDAIAPLSALYQAYAPNSYTPLPWVASEYLGISVVAFAALGATRSRRSAILLGAAAVFAWMAMGTNAGFGSIALHLPLFSGFRYAEKLAFFTALLTAGAAALGAAGWIRGGCFRGFARMTGVASVLLLGGAALGHAAPELALRLVTREGHPAESAEFAANLFAGLWHSGTVCLALAGLSAASDRGRLGERSRAIAAVALIGADLGAANAFAYVVSPAALMRPPSAFAQALLEAPGEHRVVTPFPLEDKGPPTLRPFEWAALRGAASLQSGWNVEYRVGNFEPYTGMVPARAMRFRLRTGYLHQLPMVGMWGVDHVVVPGDPKRAVEVDLPPPYDVAFTDPSIRTSLLRVPHRPRTYIAQEVLSVDRRGAMEFVLDPGSVSSARTVVEAPVSPDRRFAHGTAHVVEDHPERVEVEVETNGPALLVLNDTFAPGWRASVDGAPAEILAANYLARGVWTPAGRHRVAFVYRTPGLVAGWVLAALGTVALAGSGAVARWRRSRRVRTLSASTSAPSAFSERRG